MDFEEKVPEWDNVGAEPDMQLKRDGFKAGYKPPAAYFNWFFNRISVATKELQAKAGKEIDNKLNTDGGDISETVIKTAKESREEYPIPASGDSMKVFLGKTRKFFKDVRNWMSNVQLQGQLIYVTFTASGWTGDTAPYVQTIAVDGVTAEDNPLLVSALEDGASPEEYKAYNRAFGIIASGIGITADGSVTFKVYKKPAVDIVVGLRGVGASGSVAAGANVTNMTYSAVAPRSGENWARIVSGRLEVDPQEVSKDTTYLAQDLDADRAYLYRNTGTQTSPVWEKWYPRTTADAVEMDNGKTVEECLKDNSGGVDGLSIANGALCVTYNEEEKDV